jgi:membrane protein YqaA with SNARE-associated domain
MYRRRRRKLMILAAMAGAPIGAIFGYLFGYFAFSNMDVAKTFHAEDASANAMLFLWLFALLCAMYSDCAGKNTPM